MTVKPQLILLLFLVTLLIGCEQNFRETEVDLSEFQLQDDVKINTVVAEPLIEAPVDISFDDQGRMWVMEMPGYMRTLEGINEEEPIGRVLVLEDKDEDGQADHTRVFLDSLSLVRAIGHVYGGLLYAVPPNLWFVEIKDDLTPGKRTLVDAEYALGGNVEHQPNGLMLNIDNWIYNAKSTKRYRRINGEWLVENTSFRGQWGITHDDFGRLIYNDNSNQVRGDWVLPNVLNQNPGFRPEEAIYNNLVRDQRVFPLQPTAVNRGYIPGFLDEEGKLKNFTSACGPVFYQGTALDDKYYGDVFVCGPEVNLVKQNELRSKDFQVSGKQSIDGGEFLITPDKGFRPVNLKNGPDGAMYVVDMHRGIIQHKTYMTGYLRELYIENDLDSLRGMGRVFRLSRDGGPFNQVDLSALKPYQLLDSLSSRNIWIRQRAQHLIINSGDVGLTNALVDIMNNDENEVTRIHALYCLEGMRVLDKSQLNIPSYQEYPRLLAHVLKLSAEKNVHLTNDAIEGLLARNDTTIDYYMAYLLSRNFNPTSISYLSALLNKYEEQDWFIEPVVSGFSGDIESWRSSVNGFEKTISKVELASQNEIDRGSGEIGQDGLTKGLTLFRTHCASCHGFDGQGMAELAPPLLNSEYVSGSPEQLTSIILYGLQGPITVNGVEYAFNSPMPGLKVNTELSDDDIQEIANYLRNAFTKRPDRSITIEMVSEIREQQRDALDMFTVEELSDSFQ